MTDVLPDNYTYPTYRQMDFRTPLWHNIPLRRYQVDIYGRLWDTESSSFVNTTDGRLNATVRLQDGTSVTAQMSISAVVRSCWWNADLDTINKSDFKSAILKEKAYHEAMDQLREDEMKFVTFDDNEHRGYSMYYRWYDDVLFSEYYQRPVGHVIKFRHRNEIHEALVAHYDKLTKEQQADFLLAIPRVVTHDLLNRHKETPESEVVEPLAQPYPSERTSTSEYDNTPGAKCVDIEEVIVLVRAYLESRGADESAVLYAIANVLLVLRK